MPNFPYPVQYFVCKDFYREDVEEYLRENVKAYVAMGIAMGSIAGETGIPGLKLDFNNGLRLQVPPGNFHVKISDWDSNVVFYDRDVSAQILISMEKYFIRWNIEVSLDGAPVFSHVFDPTGQEVYFVFASRMIGDTIAVLPYVKEFIDEYHVAPSYFSVPHLRELVEHVYPGIPYRATATENTYATFYFTAVRNDPSKAPLDGRMFPMWQAGRWILNLPRFAEALPWPPSERRIAEPYVCIGVQSSHPCKGWIYPGGWDRVVEYLKSLGYRVLCIDKDARTEKDGFCIERPPGAEDWTGPHPLVERGDMLSHADFFIGLGSGLSWLAYMAHCPVIMIGGFSAYWYEFPTAYRVFNRLVCNGCFNDPRAETENLCDPVKELPHVQLECARSITPRMVIYAIDQLRKEHGLC